MIFIIASDKDLKKSIKDFPSAPIFSIANPKIKLKNTKPSTFVPVVFVWLIFHSSIGTKK